MARTQKNKATALHLGILKARLAKLRRELITPKGGGGATGEGTPIMLYCLVIIDFVLYLKSPQFCNFTMNSAPTTQLTMHESKCRCAAFCSAGHEYFLHTSLPWVFSVHSRF